MIGNQQSQMHSESNELEYITPLDLQLNEI